MFYWKIILLDGEQEYAVREKNNIKSFDKALNEVLDFVEYINLTMHEMGLDNEVSFIVGEQN